MQSSQLQKRLISVSQHLRVSVKQYSLIGDNNCFLIFKRLTTRALTSMLVVGRARGHVFQLVSGSHSVSSGSHSVSSMIDILCHQMHRITTSPSEIFPRQTILLS
jgi:hypothetical protein